MKNVDKRTECMMIEEVDIIFDNEEGIANVICFERGAALADFLFGNPAVFTDERVSEVTALTQEETIRFLEVNADGRLIELELSREEVVLLVHAENFLNLLVCWDVLG